MLQAEFPRIEGVTGIKYIFEFADNLMGVAGPGIDHIIPVVIGTIEKGSGVEYSFTCFLMECFYFFIILYILFSI